MLNTLKSPGLLGQSTWYSLLSASQNTWNESKAMKRPLRAVHATQAFLLSSLDLLSAAAQSGSQSHVHTSHNNTLIVDGMISIEEHRASLALADLFIKSSLRPLLPNSQQLSPQLIEVGPQRLASMDAGDIALQIISHVPTVAEAMFDAPATRLDECSACCRHHRLKPI